VSAKRDKELRLPFGAEGR